MGVFFVQLLRDNPYPAQDILLNLKMKTLPPELWMQIFFLLVGDHRTLARLCLVCQSMNRLASVFLYREIVVCACRDEYRSDCRRSGCFCFTRPDFNPSLAHVRSLSTPERNLVQPIHYQGLHRGLCTTLPLMRNLRSIFLHSSVVFHNIADQESFLQALCRDGSGRPFLKSLAIYSPHLVWSPSNLWSSLSLEKLEIRSTSFQNIRLGGYILAIHSCLNVDLDLAANLATCILTGSKLSLQELTLFDNGLEDWIPTFLSYSYLKIRKITLLLETFQSVQDCFHDLSNPILRFLRNHAASLKSISFACEGTNLEFSYVLNGTNISITSITLRVDHFCKLFSEVPGLFSESLATLHLEFDHRDGEALSSFGFLLHNSLDGKELAGLRTLKISNFLVPGSYQIHLDDHSIPNRETNSALVSLYLGALGRSCGSTLEEMRGIYPMSLDAGFLSNLLEPFLVLSTLSLSAETIGSGDFKVDLEPEEVKQYVRVLHQTCPSLEKVLVYEKYSTCWSEDPKLEFVAMVALDGSISISVRMQVSVEERISFHLRKTEWGVDSLDPWVPEDQVWLE